jgi:hypothetical protein
MTRSIVLCTAMLSAALAIAVAGQAPAAKAIDVIKVSDNLYALMSSDTANPAIRPSAAEPWLCW